jgi:hypothetical protein
LPAATLEAVGLITGILETEAAKLDLQNLPISKFDKITVDEFLRQKVGDEDAYKLIETTVKGLLGVDATELSLFSTWIISRAAEVLRTLARRRVTEHSTSGFDKVRLEPIFVHIWY